MNITNTKTDRLAVVVRSLDGSLLRLIESANGSEYKHQQIQASPKLLQAGRTAASALACVSKTSNTFREKVIAGHGGVIGSLGWKEGENNSTKTFINLCLLRCLFSLTLHTSPTLHVPTVLIRNSCVEQTLSHVPTPPLDDAGIVRADLCLRILAKLVDENGSEVWGRLVVSENVNKLMKLVINFLSLSWNTPPSSYDRVRKCQEMSLSLLISMTAQSEGEGFNNEKRILAGIAFEEGALDFCIQFVGKEAMRRVRKRKEMEEWGGESTEEDKEEKNGGETKCTDYMEKVESGCECIILNILEGERPAPGRVFPPAFLRACKLGWLRRAPSMLVQSSEEGGIGRGLVQRIALCMISRSIEGGGGTKIDWGERAAKNEVAGDGETTFRSSSADNLTRRSSTDGRRRSSRSTNLASSKRMSPEERFKSDTVKILKSKASTISFITMSGCLNPITHMLSHHDPRVVNYAVKIYEAMLDSWVGGAPKKGVGKKAGGGKGGGEEAGEALQVALIEQACVPLLFTMCRVGSRKYSPTFFVCEKVLKALVRKVADFESNKEKVLTSFGRMMLSKLSVSGSTALRANIGCALVLLTADCPKARRELCEGGGKDGEGDVGLVEVVMSMVQVGSRGGNLGPRVFLSTVRCLCGADERSIVDYEEDKVGGDQFYGDFDLRVIRKAGESKSLEFEGNKESGVVWVITEDNESGVKMEVPSVFEISFVAPKLAGYLKRQMEGGPDVKVTMEATSYDAAEEFFGHVVTGWAGLTKARNKYNLDFCLDLLALAETYECHVLIKAYSRCIYEKIERGNAFRILEVGMEARENWLSVVAFCRIVEDFEGCLVGGVGGGIRDQVRVLERFLVRLMGVQ